MTRDEWKARPPMSYRDLCRKAADEMQTALRANVSTGKRVYLRAWPSTPLDPGILFVEVDGEPIPADPYASRRWPAPAPMPPIFRPRTGLNWEAVPYSDLFGLIWDACRSAPIMAPGDPWDDSDNAPEHDHHTTTGDTP